MDLSAEVSAFTRLLVAVLYAVAAVVAARIPQPFRTAAVLNRLWVGILATWSLWYIVLAFGDPDPVRWGTLNRALHIPLVVYVIITSVLAKRFYESHPEFMAVQIIQQPKDDE